MTTARPQLPALTGLRFLAALHVVLFHGRLAFADSPGFVLRLVEHGNIGVNLFFVLSGFVLAYNYLDDGRDLDVRDFWVARFARIYPVCLLAFLLFTPAVFITAVVPAGRTLATVLSTLTLTQAWTGLMTWNTPGWSLSGEAFFYLVFPLIGPALRGRSPRRLLALGAVVWLAGLVAPVLFWSGAIGEAWADVVFYNPLLRLPEFVVGVALGKVFLSRAAAPRWSAWSATAAAALLVALLGSDVVPSVLLHNGVLDPLFALLLYGLAGGGGPLGRVLSTRPMVVLGEASYSVYILQSPVFGWFKGAMLVVVPAGAPAPWALRLFVAVYCVLLTLVSVLVLFRFEMPARRAIRRRFARAAVSVPGGLETTVRRIP